MADLLESESVAVILHGLSILVSLVLAIITFMAVRQSKKTADSTLVERNNLTILGLLVAVVLAAGCGGSKTDEEIAAINAAGEEQLELHADDPLVQPLDLQDLELVSETVTPAYVATEQKLLTTDPVRASRYWYNYEMEGVDIVDILDDATTYFESLGATIELFQPNHRILRAESLGDDIQIELKVRDSPNPGRGTMDHRARIISGVSVE